MPEVPTEGPSKEQEKLDLPNVPTKVPVASRVVADDAEIAPAEASTKKRGVSLSLSLSLSLTHTHTHTLLS